MKILAVLFLVFALSLVSGKRTSKHVNHGGEKRHLRHGNRHHQHAAHFNGKDTVKKMKHGHHGLSKVHRKMYKKFAMMAVPGVSLEDTSALQGQVSQPVQQIMVPVNSGSASQEMVSSYSNTPAQPSQPSQLGTEVAGDQTVTNQGGQPATVQYQGGQQETEQPTEEVKTGTQGNAGVAQPEVAGGPTETVDPNAAANSVQSFVQPAEAGKGESLQGYNGGALQAGSDQLKAQGNDIGPQEEVKVVNLGDDEKAANTEDRSCGGCPMNAKCVNGQCQIREEDARTQGLTGGKGTLNNPGTVGDIHNLESQELKTLLKDANSADAAVGATAEAPPTSSRGPALTQSPDQAQGQLQEQEQQQTAGQQPELAGQQPDLAGQPADQQTPPTPSQQSTQPPPQLEGHFSGAQVKELRDFARMYKMYKFIRKMEQRINDPDCAPICRKVCKSFCPAKCCRRRHGNATLQASLAQTVANVKGTGGKMKAMDAKLMEDEDDAKDKEDDEMDEKAGSKHVFVQIAKNNELDKPRRYI